MVGAQVPGEQEALLEQPDGSPDLADIRQSHGLVNRNSSPLPLAHLRPGGQLQHHRKRECLHSGHLCALSFLRPALPVRADRSFGHGADHAGLLIGLLGGAQMSGRPWLHRSLRQNSPPAKARRDKQDFDYAVLTATERNGGRLGSHFVRLFKGSGRRWTKWLECRAPAAPAALELSALLSISCSSAPFILRALLRPTCRP